METIYNTAVVLAEVFKLKNNQNKKMQLLLLASPNILQSCTHHMTEKSLLYMFWDVRVRPDNHHQILATKGSLRLYWMCRAIFHCLFQKAAETYHGGYKLICVENQPCGTWAKYTLISCTRLISIVGKFNLNIVGEVQVSPPT